MWYARLNQLTYCILHAWQGLPEYLPSDLDIVIAPDDLPRLENALLEVVGARLVNLLQHESACYYFVLALRDGEGLWFLPVDAATDYRRDGRVWFSAEDLLHGRQRWKEFWVAAPEVEFKYLLVKKILKGSVPEHAAERLGDLTRELGGKAEEITVDLLGSQLGEQAVRWMETGAWEEFQNHIRELQKALKRQIFRKDPFNVLRYWLPEVRRIWQRWWYPTGLFVAVLGPDGSGKSTLISYLERDLKGAFRRTTVFHLMPGLLRERANSGPVTDPHGKSPRSLPASFFKLLYYLLDYNLGYALKVRPALVKSTFVFFDRYYDDLLVDPKRYRYGGPLWLIRWFRRLVPRPDLWLILDVPEEEIWRRKQEVSLEEVRRQREAYRRLAGELPNAFLLDGSLPPGEVAGQAREIVLNYLHERYLNRRHLWFPKAKKDDLSWLETALGARRTSNGKPFLHFALPDGRGYLLPTNSRRVALQSLSLYAPQKTKAKVAKGLLRLGLKSGIAQRLLPKVQLNLDDLREMLAEVFDRRNLVLAAVSLGTPGPHRKPVLQVLGEKGEVLGYVKVGWNEETKRLVKNEVQTLKALQEQPLLFDVPEVLYFGKFKDKMLCVQGVPPTGARPTSVQLTEEYIKALCSLAKMGLRWQFLEQTLFWERIVERSQEVKSAYWRHLLMEAVDNIRERWKDGEIPFHFAHGDFTPWNAFQVNGKIYLYDWEYAQENAPVGYDLFHFMVRVLLLVQGFSFAEIVQSVIRWNQSEEVGLYWNQIGIERHQIDDLFRLYCIHAALEALCTYRGNQSQYEGNGYVRIFALMSVL